MKSLKSRNLDFSKITSTIYNENKTLSESIKRNLTSRTDTLNQNSTVTSIQTTSTRTGPSRVTNKDKNERSIINLKINIKENIRQIPTATSVRRNTNTSFESDTSLNSSRSSKKLFYHHYHKKSLDLRDTQTRYSIKVGPEYGKPSKELQKFNDREMRSSRSNSFQRLDTFNRIFDTQQSTSTEVRNHRSFKYPHGQAKVGELLMYKYAPVFRQDKLPRSINKNDFDILKKVQKYTWEK